MGSAEIQKPQEIIEFDEVFEKHVGDKFVRGTWIFEELKSRLAREKPGSPFVLIVGEAGIGKTALIANYLSDRKDRFVHFFLEEKKPDRLDSVKFTKHLYASLSRIHGWDDVDEIRGYTEVPLEPLRERIREISQRKLAQDEQQVIVVDGLDESEGAYGGNLSIVDVLRGIDFPDNFRIIVSSREFSELNHFQAPDRSNVIMMTGSSQENQEDIKGYLLDNLSSKGVEAEDLDILIKRSEGNFQYATLIVDMIQSGEAGADWLIQHPPNGLNDIYEWKLRKVWDGVKNKDELDNIWRIMRTISLLYRPQSPRVICEILNIDYRYIKRLFSPLEQFLDVSIYRMVGTCSWYHSSFPDYLTHSDRLPENERISIHRDIVKYIETYIESGRIRELPSDFIGDLALYFCAIREKPECLAYVRNCIPIEFLRNPSQKFLGKLADLMYRCYLLAQDELNANYMLFFYFMSRGYDYHIDGKKLRRPVLPETLRDMNEEHVAIWKKSGGPMLAAQILSMAGIGGYVEASQAGSCLLIEGTSLSMLLPEAAWQIRKEFDDLKSIYDVCAKCASDWFPTKEETRGESSMETSGISAGIRADVSSPTAPHLIKVILNGEFTSMKRSEVEEYKKNPEVTLVTEESRQRVWVLGEEVAIDQERTLMFKLLCLIARYPPGTVHKYESVLKLVWGEKPEDMLAETMREKILRVVREEIRPLGMEPATLRKHVLTVRKVGLKTAKRVTMLFIPSPVTS